MQALTKRIEQLSQAREAFEQGTPLFSYQGKWQSGTIPAAFLSRHPDFGPFLLQ